MHSNAQYNSIQLFANYENLLYFFQTVFRKIDTLFFDSVDMNKITKQKIVIDADDTYDLLFIFFNAYSVCKQKHRTIKKNVLYEALAAQRKFKLRLTFDSKVRITKIWRNIL